VEKKLQKLEQDSTGKIPSLDIPKKTAFPVVARCNEIRGKDNISYSEMFEVIKLLRKLRTKANAGDDFEEHF
jgi:hypothetical protein